MSFKLFDKEKKKRNDIVFIALVLAASSILGLAFYLCRGEGSYVEVEVEGQYFGEYSLASDIEVEISSKNGYNRLVIKDGKATVTKASCPDGICSSHRPVSRVGESIVCLPNKVVVTVKGSSKNQPDIVA